MPAGINNGAVSNIIERNIRLPPLLVKEHQRTVNPKRILQVEIKKSCFQNELPILRIAIAASEQVAPKLLQNHCGQFCVACIQSVCQNSVRPGGMNVLRYAFTVFCLNLIHTGHAAFLQKSRVFLQTAQMGACFAAGGFSSD